MFTPKDQFGHFTKVLFSLVIIMTFSLLWVVTLGPPPPRPLPTATSQHYPDYDPLAWRAPDSKPELALSISLINPACHAFKDADAGFAVALVFQNLTNASLVLNARLLESWGLPPIPHHTVFPQFATITKIPVQLPYRAEYPRFSELAQQADFVKMPPYSRIALTARIHFPFYSHLENDPAETPLLAGRYRMALTYANDQREPAGALRYSWEDWAWVGVVTSNVVEICVQR